MPLYAKDNQKEFVPLSAGTHIGKVCGIIHIGTLTDIIQNKEVTRNRVYISFEVPDEKKEDGKSYVVGQEFTLSMNKNGNLLPFIESMLGKKLSKEESKEFDVFTLIGKTAMLNIIHSEPNSDGNVFANIKSISPLPRGMECPETEIEPYKFDYDENFNPDFVFAMNDKTLMYKKITRSEEWIAKGLKNDVKENFDNMN